MALRSGGGMFNRNKESRVLSNFNRKAIAGFAFKLSLSFLISVPWLCQGLTSGKPRPSEKKMWFYFDLGDTLINAKDMNHLRYFPGVRVYLRQLKSHGLRIGMITNIPESWGTDYPQKLRALKKVISQGWDEREAFEWELFDEIILPLRDTERKPSPVLFLQAIDRAWLCPSAFISESNAEIDAARKEGMAAKLFEPKDRELFVRPERAREFLLRNYKRKFDPRCAMGVNVASDESSIINNVSEVNSFDLSFRKNFVQAIFNLKSKFLLTSF
jgi:beta-phosphoglucomutase-like phosphatase (HAD superfamily)